MSKLCALVIGHKKRSLGAINVNSNLRSLISTKIWPFVLRRRFKKQKSRGFIEGHTRSFLMI
jgi:hypothetical protein